MNQDQATGAGAGPGSGQTPTRKNWVSLACVLFVQLQNAFNDNLVKFVLIGLALAVAAGTPIGDNIQYILSALLPLPFILLAPIAGFLADRHSKRSVIYVCLIAQFLMFAFTAAAVLLRNIPLAITGFFLLSVQSTFFSPAKLGILKDLVGSARLGMANGLMQMLTMVGILAGMWLGGMWFDGLLQKYNAASVAGPNAQNAWRAAFVPIAVIGGGTVLALIVGCFIERTPAHPDTEFHKTVFFRHFVHLRYVFARPILRITALGIAYYWFVAYLIGLVLVSFGKQLHPNLVEGGASSAASAMTATIGVGLIIGSSLVSLLSRNRIELGMIPFGGLGLTLGLLGAGLFDPTGGWFRFSLAFIGFSGGFYVVPLTAFLQDQAEEAHRGRVLAANNLVVSFTGVLAIASGMTLDNLGVSPSLQMLVFVLPTFVVTIVVFRKLPRNVFHFVFQLLLKLVYRIRTLHPENMPREGGVLLLSNHVTYIDAFILSAASPRQIRFLVLENYGNVRVIAWFLRLFDVIFISQTHARNAIRTTVDALVEGSVVCVFPEGQLTRTGMLNEFKKGFEVMARQSGVPVLPAYMDSLWGSIFSFERGRYFRKIPRRIPYGVTVTFGKPIAPEEAVAARARSVIEELSVEAVAGRRILRETLPAAVARALKKRRHRTAAVDRTGGRLCFSRATLLATAETIAARWMKQETFAGDESRVGVLLPHGAPALVLELAVIFAGKVPVILPLDSAPSREQLARWGIRTVVSSQKVREHLVTFPWPEGFVDMSVVFRNAPRTGLALFFLRAYLEPAFLAVWRHRPRTGSGNQEGEACGYVFRDAAGGHLLAPLSHRQVLANVSQIACVNAVHKDECILSELPVHTAAGHLLSLWFPVLQGHPLVSLSLAATDDALATILREESVAILLSRPDRWDALAKSAVPGSSPLPQLRLVFSFGEGPPAAGLVEAVSEKLAVTVAPGFAEDRLGVILSLSMEDPATIPAGLAAHQAGWRPGAVGRLLPGFAVRIDSPGGRALDPGDEGLLKLRGASLAASALWVEPGRVGHFDADGFLFLG